MADATCVIPGCGGPVHRKKHPWCSKHYQRWRKHGDPLRIKVVPDTCIVPNCSGPHHARGWCGMHYGRWLKFGTPTPSIPEPPVAGEQWRPVVGWEGWYEVSDHGRVRRVARGTGTEPGRILIPQKVKDGYLRVRLSRSDQQRWFGVHRLVAEAFIGPPPAGQECNHKSGDKADNWVGNLEWLTKQGNMQHAFRTGITQPLRGERHPMTKLTAEQVAEIRRLAGIESGGATAARFGVTRSYVSKLRRGEWRRGG